MMKTSKAMRDLTIAEWLMHIPDPEVRAKAVANHRSAPFPRASSSVKLLSDALYEAFFWDESPEGFRFWNDVIDLIEDEEQPMKKS